MEWEKLVENGGTREEWERGLLWKELMERLEELRSEMEWYTVRVSLSR